MQPVDTEGVEQRYVTHNNNNKPSVDTISYQSSVDEYYVLPEKSKQHGTIYVNPGALDHYSDTPHLYQSLDDSSSVSSRTLSSSLSDQNGNSKYYNYCTLILSLRYCMQAVL